MNNSNGYSKNVVVKKSGIHGKGIFAGTDFKKNSFIMWIKGDVIDGGECLRRENEENNVYIFWNGDTYIDTANSKKIRYINHNCSPNCEVEDGDEKRLKLFAARKIKKGEELTIDYGYEEIYDGCKCSTCKRKSK